MNYNIKGTGVSVTPELRDYVERRLASLERFAGEAARTDVELEHEPLRDGPRYRAEMMYHEPALPRPLRAEARGGAMHEAVDIAAAELFRTLTQSRQKRIDILRRSAVKVKEYLRGWRDRF